MVRSLLFAGVAAALLASCATVGPDYAAPTLAPATLPSASAGDFTAAHPVANWWSQFDDPALDALVRQSLLANHDVRIAVARVNQARAVFSERRLDLAPHVTAGVEATRTRQTVEGQRTTSEIYSAGFDAGWELDLFGRIRRSTEAAHADLQAQRNDLEAMQVSVAAETARNYFELRGTQKQLAVARRTLANLAQTQQLTETRYTLGAGSQLDVQNSLAQVRAVEAEVPMLEAAESQSRHRLAVLTGQRPGELDLPLDPVETPALAKTLPIGDATAVLRQRPDVRAAERRLAAATARIGVATADLFPRVSLRGFIGFIAGGWGSLGDSGTDAWSVTPSVSWAAFDIGSVRAQLRATEAQADEIAADYEKTVLTALEDADNALLSYAKRQAQLKLRLEQSVAARRAAELAEARYRAGASDFLTLLDAQRSQLVADDALARAEAGVNIAVATLYKALGGWGEADIAPALAARP